MDIINIYREDIADDAPDVSWLEAWTKEGTAEDRESARERLAAFERGAWHMIGVRATAKLRFENGCIADITSPGLWGVESDSGEDYLRSIYVEELDQLGEMLHEMGFGASDILEHAPELCRHESNEVTD